MFGFFMDCPRISDRLLCNITCFFSDTDHFTKPTPTINEISYEKIY